MIIDEITTITISLFLDLGIMGSRNSELLSSNLPGME
jgi:hypothetical protein